MLLRAKVTMLFLEDKKFQETKLSVTTLELHANLRKCCAEHSDNFQQFQRCDDYREVPYTRVWARIHSNHTDVWNLTEELGSDSILCTINIIQFGASSYYEQKRCNFVL